MEKNGAIYSAKPNKSLALLVDTISEDPSFRFLAPL